MIWRIHLSEHTWYWFCELGNGWTAGVVDDSQVGWPKTKTHYRVFASSQMVHRDGPVCWYLTLPDAKEEALKLALTLAPCEVT